MGVLARKIPQDSTFCKGGNKQGTGAPKNNQSVGVFNVRFQCKDPLFGLFLQKKVLTPRYNTPFQKGGV